LPNRELGDFGLRFAVRADHFVDLVIAIEVKASQRVYRPACPFRDRLAIELWMAASVA